MNAPLQHGADAITTTPLQTGTIPDLQPAAWLHAAAQAALGSVALNARDRQRLQHYEARLLQAWRTHDRALWHATQQDVLSAAFAPPSPWTVHRPGARADRASKPEVGHGGPGSVLPTPAPARGEAAPVFRSGEGRSAPPSPALRRALRALVWPMAALRMPRRMASKMPIIP